MNEIEALINDYKADEKLAPGISVALIKEGNCVFKESIGFSNLENRIKITSKTNFYIASLSKKITASAIMLLHERGDLDIYDGIGKYFEDLQDIYKDIKIINLVNHTSGLKDYFGFFIEKGILRDVTNQDVYNFLSEKNILEFQTGTKFEYSNTGYVLLSMLVEKISGTTFSEFLKENIFLPLNMKNTSVFTQNKPIIKNRAYGYREINEDFFCDDYSILTTGDGGVYSNIDDLMLWDQAFNTEKIFSASTIEKLFSSEKISKDVNINYGFGWFIRNRNSKKVVFHDGSGFGFRTFMGKSLEDNITIIILSNCYKSMWDKIYQRCSYIISELNDYYHKFQ